MNQSVLGYNDKRSAFKTVIVGERAVGKTSLAVRYIKGVFNRLYAVTVGVEFYSKIFTSAQEQYALQIWDTAGQQSFKSLIRSFYNQASCIVIAYSDPEQMSKTIDNYLNEVRQFAAQEAIVVIARTKSDLLPILENQIEWLQDKIQRQQILCWMEVSAKSGLNVQKFFEMIQDKLVQKYLSSEKFRDLVQAKKIRQSICLTKEQVEASTQQTAVISGRRKRCCNS